MSMSIMINCRSGDYLLDRTCLLCLFVVILCSSPFCVFFLVKLAIEGSYLLEVVHI
jgi:hypothetical protein